jgi:hypothetical protein
MAIPPDEESKKSKIARTMAWTDPLAKEDRADGSKRRIRIKTRSQRLVIPIVVTENIVSQWAIVPNKNGESFNSRPQNFILQTLSVTSSFISKVALSFAVQYQCESENSCATGASQSRKGLNLCEILDENN